MKRLRPILVGVALGAVLAGAGAPALAAQQDTTAQRAELAAATLAANDLPDGFAFAGETFLTAEQVAGDALDPAVLQETGFEAQYVSVYENRGQRLRVRSYVSAWTDESAAEAGFALLEDEATVSPGAALTDAGTTLGDDPREVTSGTYTDASGATIATIDTTFRRGDLVAGVAVEKLDGSPVDAAIASGLTERLDARVQQVLQGESPEFTDLTLPSQVLPLETLGAGIQVGFLGPAEVERMYGLQGSVLDSVQTTWAESVAVGGDTGPTVTLGVTIFGDPQDAADAVQNADQLVLPLANQQAIDGVALEGADAVRAFRFTSPGAANADAIDSYRIVFATGERVTVVDVQRAPGEQVATDSATALAQAQVGCQGGTCQLPELPAELTGGS